MSDKLKAIGICSSRIYAYEFTVNLYAYYYVVPTNKKTYGDKFEATYKLCVLLTVSDQR
jgi:hypothetical protein